VNLNLHTLACTSRAVGLSIERVTVSSVWHWCCVCILSGIYNNPVLYHAAARTAARQRARKSTFVDFQPVVLAFRTRRQSSAGKLVLLVVVVITINRTSKLNMPEACSVRLVTQVTYILA
jgi:hypothetical protein